MGSPHHGHMACGPAQVRCQVPPAAVTAACEVRQPEGERDSWECSSPGQTQGHSGTLASRAYFSTSWAAVSVIIQGPGKSTRFWCSPWTSCLSSCLDELVSSRTRMLNCHRVKSVHMLPFSPQRARSSFSKEKFTPFCLIRPQVYMSGFIPSPDTVCLGIRQAWVAENSQHLPPHQPILNAQRSCEKQISHVLFPHQFSSCPGCGLLSTD